MRHFLIILCLTALFLLPTMPPPAHSQQGRSFAVAELNCENLFDTIRASDHEDEEFTPWGSRYWGTRRYRRKLNLLAREIVSLDPPLLPDVMALVEVENETVLRDLTTHTGLAPLGYRYIVGQGADHRGINTALIYLEGSFRPTRTYHLLGKAEQQSLGLATRSILGVEGLSYTGDTLHILVIHAPSKLGGLDADRKRAVVFGILRAHTDSLLSKSPYANIIIMGDFNEVPHSRAIRRHLGALAPTGNPCPNRLYNLACHPRSLNGAGGTYRYRGHWQMIDQCVLSGSLLKGTRAKGKGEQTAYEYEQTAHEGMRTSSKAGPAPALYADEESLIIIDHPFLMEADKQYGGVKPWRTFTGDYYRGGFSDHLPLLLRLHKR